MKDDDIPDEVWEIAHQILYDMKGADGTDLSILAGAINRAISDAVKKEREACAKIGDQAYDYAKTEYDKDPNDGPFTLRGAMAVGRAISKAIRKRQSKDG